MTFAVSQWGYTFLTGRVRVCRRGEATVGLSININSPSREAMDSKMSEAITALAAGLIKRGRQDKLPKGPALDITFMLAGKLDKPDFTGMRMGGYTDEENTLYFERAVPEEWLQSPHADKLVNLVLQDALDNATDYFADRGRIFNVTGWKSILAQLMLAK